MAKTIRIRPNYRSDLVPLSYSFYHQHHRQQYERIEINENTYDDERQYCSNNKNKGIESILNMKRIHTAHVCYMYRCF